MTISCRSQKWRQDRKQTRILVKRGDPRVACIIKAPGRLAEHVTTTYQSINDLGQNLLGQVWLDRENVVFSPLSLHIALAMLTSGATEGSTTQRELLDVLERSENIQGLESYYHGIFQDQKKDLLVSDPGWT